MIRLSEILKIEIPSALAAPSPTLDADLASLLFGQSLIQKGISLEAAMALASGLKNHIALCRVEMGDYGLKGMRGILKDVKRFTRNTKDGDPYMEKGTIVLRFDEDAKKDEEINTGTLSFCGTDFVPEDMAFEVALSNTMFNRASELIGQKFYGNKLLFEAATQHSDNGKVRMLVNIFGAERGDRSSDSDTKSSRTNKTREAKTFKVTGGTIADGIQNYDAMVSEYGSEDDFWDDVVEPLALYVQYDLGDSSVKIDKGVYSKIEEEIQDAFNEDGSIVDGDSLDALVEAFLEAIKE